MRFVIIGTIVCLTLAGAYTLGRLYGANKIGGDSVVSAIEKFAYSSDPDVRLSTVRIVKAAYITATSTIERAHLLNALTGMMHSAHEPRIFDEVFAGPPFEAYIDEQSAEASIANLSRLSISLHETAYAVHQMAFGDSLRIRSLAKRQRSLEQERELNDSVKAVLESVERARSLIDRDVTSAESPAESLNVLLSYYQWQGHLLGDVAMVRPEYLDQSLNFIETAIRFAESFRDQKGHVYPFTVQKIAALHWGYVRYAIAADPSMASNEKVLAHADGLTHVLRDKWDQLAAFQIMFSAVRDYLNGHTAPHETSGNLHAELVKRQTEIVRDIWKISTSSRQFLREQGIDFSDTVQQSSS